MVRTRRMMTRGLAILAVGAGCIFTAACSVPGTYPTVLADPAPRPGSTLSPDEVKQATDSLISDRNHLCSAAVANAAPGNPPPDCAAQSATGTTAKP
jgi:hypothetical protein